MRGGAREEHTQQWKLVWGGLCSTACPLDLACLAKAAGEHRGSALQCTAVHLPSLGRRQPVAGSG